MPTRMTANVWSVIGTGREEERNRHMRAGGNEERRGDGQDDSARQRLVERLGALQQAGVGRGDRLHGQVLSR